MATWAEKLMGLLLAIAALVWAAFHWFIAHQFQPGFLRLGPMQILMAGLMLWLHGKHRAMNFTRARREYQVRFRDF
jgi:hypothetical protein